MKKACVWLLFLMTLLMPASGMGEDAAQDVAMWINGEAVYQSQINAVVASVVQNVEQLGLDTSGEEMLSAITEVARQQVIENRLLSQDMTAQGMYEFTQEDESAVASAVQETMDAMLADYTAYYASLDQETETTAEQQAQAAMEAAGYTEDFFDSYYRNVLASERYEAWLVRDDDDISDEMVETAYQQRTAEGESLYAQDVAAFETALAAGQEIWYRPSGYRAILQIMLPAEGETDEEKLESVRETTQEIYARLEAGETFESLLSEYGEDAAFDDPAFLETGYQVHPDSVLWEEAFVQSAFSQELAEPGDVSQPCVLGDNVCILYYLKDVEGGAAKLTDDLREALRADLYAQLIDDRLEERLNELEAEAENRLSSIGVSLQNYRNPIAAVLDFGIDAEASCFLSSEVLYSKNP